jgi:hypothetical protein
MEKIMSKTNDTSNIEHHDTLADSELDAVSGGADFCKLYPDKCSYVPPPPPPHLSAL